MLIIGIAYLVVCFQENFGMNFQIKHLITVGFLCYMTLVWKMPFSHQAVIKVLFNGHCHRNHSNGLPV